MTVPDWTKAVSSKMKNVETPQKNSKASILYNSGTEVLARARRGRILT